MNTGNPTRRDLFTASAGAFGAAESVLAQTSSASGSGVPTRPLGKTGVRVSILGLGGHHAARQKEESESFRIIHTAVNEGITFMDNAWEYHNGRAEEVMGKALAMDGYRKKVFLMTKVCDRDYEGAKRQLDESLQRLRTDVIDLLQFHECNYYNDPDLIQEKGGLRAAIEARKAGKIRFIGFTGHKNPAIHQSMLQVKFDWDACQMPNNVFDAGFLSFRHGVMPVCEKKKVGVIGMKGCCGDGRILTDNLATVEECYRYCLSQPISTQVVGLASMEHLQTALRIARTMKPMHAAEVQAILKRNREVMADGRYERFKTTQVYDSSHHRKQHGFAV
jgi:predicted aldo/keto reductase-like oxidoreductase